MSSDLVDGLNIRTDDTVWMKNGKIHREDGPAIHHFSGYFAWYLEGMRHRLDGPAIIWKDGSMEWWIDDVQLTESEFNQWIAKKVLNERIHTNLEKSLHIR